MAQRKRADNTFHATTVIATGVLLAGLYFAQDALIPVVLSILLTFLLGPIANLLERWGVGRILSVLVVAVVAFGVIGSIGWVVYRQVEFLANDLPNYTKEIEKKANFLRSGGGLAQKLTGAMRQLEDATAEPTTHADLSDEPQRSATNEFLQNPKQVAVDQVNKTNSNATDAPLGSTKTNPVYTVPLDAPAAPIQRLQTVLLLIAPPLGTAALVVVFVVFMLLEREQLRDRAIRLISGGRYTVTTTALNDAARRISRYILAQTIVNGSYGVAVATGLWLVGLTFGNGTGFPSFVLWGLLCAVLRFVPYVGPFVAAAFPLALSLAVFPGFTVFLATAALLILIELISNNVMEPWLYGASTGLSTIAILVSAVFWTTLWGTEGLLLATPLTVCLVVMGKYVPHMKFLDVLLSDEPALRPSVSFYQRLLADKPLDALKIATAEVEAHSLDQVADKVFLPALRRSRHDRVKNMLTSEKEIGIYEATRKIALELFQGNDRGPLPPVEERLLGCTAHHASEEVTLQLLEHMTRPDGVAVDVISSRSMAVDIESSIEKQQPSILLIAVLPPGGVVQARYLCRRLRRKFPELRIIIGYWGHAKNFDKLLIRFRAAGASYVATSLVQTRAQILALLKTTPHASAVAVATTEKELHP
ncbi:MAG TPA: AI-2E family transporter [Tepidisphaeraceae bacterium]|jgi:predicted PurR-regulated permease PerM